MIFATGFATTTADLFDTMREFRTGDSPTNVVSGDLDSDGILDMVTANADGGDLSVLLGTGDGRFPTEVSYPVGGRPKWITIGDLDNDGSLDLAVVRVDGPTTLEPGIVSILLGNGDGTFQPYLRYAAGVMPSSVAIGDLDGDANPDLVVANHDSFDVSILMGNGDGTMQPAIDLYSGGFPTSVAVHDLNGDGNLDLAVAAEGSHNVNLGLGRGDGTFRPAVAYVAGNSPRGVAVGDLDGDGIPDLAVSCSYRIDAPLYQGNGEFAVLLGSGDGTFQPRMAYAAGDLPGSIGMDDLNGDGDADLVVLNGDSNTVTVVLNTSEFVLNTVSADLACTPASGTLSFSSLFQVSMTNHYADQVRRFHYTIQVTLANGTHYTNWRRGWQNILAGETYTRQWWQTIPDVPGVVGPNLFELTVADVTPPPYNLPPYPPAGNTDRDSCTVTGVAP